MKNVNTQKTVEEAAENYKATITDAYGIDEDCKQSFIKGATWQAERMYSEEDMLKAAEYGYNFHKATFFPSQSFQDSCMINTRHWLTTFRKR